MHSLVLKALGADGSNSRGHVRYLRCAFGYKQGLIDISSHDLYRGSRWASSLIVITRSTLPAEAENCDMSLRHFSLPAWPKNVPPKFPAYAFASDIQSRLQQDLLYWKAKASSAVVGTNLRDTAPLPTVLSFSPTPTFTLGRRQAQPLSSSQSADLQAPLQLSPEAASGKASYAYAPQITHAPRGGLATYHGPGQVVIWPVVDLHSPLHRHLTVRDYACLLEKTTIATLAQLGISGFTTENPGVWVRHGQAQGQTEAGSGEDRKVTALGVHLRRHVTGLGVAVNNTVPVTGPISVNPWARIVPCGLDEKGVTSIQAELSAGAETSAAEGTSEEAIAAMWTREFASRLGLDGSGVQRLGWEELKAELRISDDDAAAAYPEADLV